MGGMRGGGGKEVGEGERGRPLEGKGDICNTVFNTLNNKKKSRVTNAKNNHHHNRP